MIRNSISYSCANVLLCGLTWAQVSADDSENGKWIPLPTEGYVCVMPASYSMPYTQRGIQQRIASGTHLHRNNSERGVFLRGDQVIGLSCTKSGELEFLKEVPGGKLRELSVLAPWISDEGIVELRRFHELRKLTLMLDRLDNMAEILAAAPHLQLFSFSSPLNHDPATASDKYFFSDEQFALFDKLADLRCIHIHSRRLSDEAIRRAVKLPKLEVLGIRGTRLITNKGFEALTEAKQLKEIVLEAGPHCTDAGVKQLLELENLEWIEIYGMAQIDEATVDALKSRFPKAEIQFKPLVGQ